MADQDNTAAPQGQPQADKSEKDLMAEWANMAAAEGTDTAAKAGAAPGETAAAAPAATATPAAADERILDQSEIDSLLGVGDDGDSQKAKSGIRALLESNIISYQRLPLLEIIFDRFERVMSTSLRQFTADNVDLSIENITSVRYGEYMNTIPLPAGLVVVNAVGLDDYILVVYESRLIYAVVDILLGGRKARPTKIEGRNFTTIERKMVEKLSEVVLAGLDEAFAPVAPVQFKYERMEVNPRFATVSREGNACVLITVRVNLEERDGVMQFCMPYATLEPIRDQLLQQFMGEKFGHDNIWENHLSQELYHTHVTMKCVMDEQLFRLSDVLNWRVGDTVVFNARKGDAVKLKCGNVTKLVGSVGKADDRMAVRVLRTVSDINNKTDGDS